MDVPVQFVDEKVRKLETAGVIIIGELPPWYGDSRAKRKVRNLTNEEVTANVQAKKQHLKKVEENKKLAAMPAPKSFALPEAEPPALAEPPSVDDDSRRSHRRR